MFCQYYLNVRNLYACGTFADIKPLFYQQCNAFDELETDWTSRADSSGSKFGAIVADVSDHCMSILDFLVSASPSVDYDVS